ncbi:MAG TPA: DUF885 domain-containing protein [Chitinophagales bacterium]|nr:DUF885 domain-containing protein [Chitinophagales bacterium]
MLSIACNTPQKKVTEDKTDVSFDAFTERFLDAYWKQNPPAAINAGYGKYYELLKIPDSAAFAGDVIFSKNYLDSLSSFNYEKLSDKHKIDYNILENQLRATIWYIDTFKLQQWDPSGYNLSNECYEIIHRDYAPLNERLKILSQHLEYAPDYFAAAKRRIKEPTKEYTELAIHQNEGGLDVFGSSLADSIKASGLSQAEKDTLQQRISRTTSAVTNYVSFLKEMLADNNVSFRSFRIGEALFNRKFKYDIVTDYSPKEIYEKAVAAKKSYHQEMYATASELWPKYCSSKQKPSDSLLLIKTVIDAVSLHHAAPEDFVDTIKKQVHALEHFIIQKNLFNYDTAYPLQVRIMPAYMSGVSLASASQAQPYQKNSVTYYNIADLTAVPKESAESQLRENNNWMLSILSIHEAMPGHCLQGVYNSKSPDILKAVFSNGAMVEGWAVYTERMMLENGWSNNDPEMWLMFYKWSLRECCNVIIDYGMQCENYSKEDFVKLLKNEAFQEDAQVEEKYHRAMVSQVQLCSYFTGATEINALRAAWQKKKGDQYSLKDFHEQFLSYGSAPVKFIGELMMKE